MTWQLEGIFDAVAEHVSTITSMEHTNSSSSIETNPDYFPGEQPTPNRMFLHSFFWGTSQYKSNTTDLHSTRHRILHGTCFHAIRLRLSHSRKTNPLPLPESLTCGRISGQHQVHLRSPTMKRDIPGSQDRLTGLNQSKAPETTSTATKSMQASTENTW